MSKPLSRRADVVIQKYLDKKDITVLNFWEKVTHDGYDEYGPKSDLYDLYISYSKDGKKFVDNWHAEQWFRPNEDTEYQFWSSREDN